jgi:hypothetical protein
MWVVILASAAETALFSHRPVATVVGSSQPTFLLQFNLPCFIKESQSYNPLFLSTSELLYKNSKNFMLHIFFKFFQREIIHIYRGHSPCLKTHSLKTFYNASIVVCSVCCALSSIKCPYNFTLLVRWPKKMTESINIRFQIYCFLKKHGSSYSVDTSCIPNPNFYIM